MRLECLENTMAMTGETSTNLGTNTDLVKECEVSSREAIAMQRARPANLQANTLIPRSPAERCMRTRPTRSATRRDTLYRRTCYTFAQGGPLTPAERDPERARPTAHPGQPDRLTRPALKRRRAVGAK